MLTIATLLWGIVTGPRALAWLRSPTPWIIAGVVLAAGWVFGEGREFERGRQAAAIERAIAADRAENRQLAEGDARRAEALEAELQETRNDRDTMLARLTERQTPDVDACRAIPLPEALRGGGGA